MLAAARRAEQGGKHRLVIMAGRADTTGMVPGRGYGKRVAAGLAVAWIAGSVGCTSAGGAPAPPPAPAASPRASAPGRQPRGERAVPSPHHASAAAPAAPGPRGGGAAVPGRGGG